MACICTCCCALFLCDAHRRVSSLILFRNFWDIPLHVLCEPRRHSAGVDFLLYCGHHQYLWPPRLCLFQRALGRLYRLALLANRLEVMEGLERGAHNVLRVATSCNICLLQGRGLDWRRSRAGIRATELGWDTAQEATSRFVPMVCAPHSVLKRSNLKSFHASESLTCLVWPWCLVCQA